MKKKWIKSIAIICAAALFAESFSGMGSLTVKAASANDYLLGESNVFLDKGGYKTEPYGQVTIKYTEHKERVDVLPKRENIYLTNNYTNKVATVPTSDWVSSVVFDKFSESLYVHPMAFRATSMGMEMAMPAVEDVSYHSDNEPAVQSLLEDSSVELVMGGSGFTAVDARMDAATDWAYDISMKDASGSAEILTTLAKGSPYVYYRFTNVTPALSLGGGATDMAINQNSISSNNIGVSVKCKTDNSTHYYGVYASAGTTWSQSNGQLQANLPEGKKWITVAALPDGTPETFSLYEKYAANRITDTRVDWDYDEASSDVTTVYNVTTTNMDDGQTGGDTIIALYPHQWRYAEGVTYTGKEYQTVRGTMKTTVGKSYTTHMTYSGILAAMPTPVSDKGLGTLKDQISYFWDYYQNTMGGTYTEYGDWEYGGYDTYWMGKNINKRADIVFMAEQIKDDSAEWTQKKQDILDALRKELEYWFDPSQGYTADMAPTITNFFYYYEDFGTLIGYNSSYSSDSELNDHHFHYGYWIKAAAAVAEYVDGWADQWDALVYEMISDIANPNRDGTNLNVQRTDKKVESNTQYPFMRNFDIYEGHSWASGVANYEFDANGNLIDPAGGLAGGNNQESTSEAVNAWSSLILWGEAVGDTKIRDLGVYLYTTEVAAIEDYYFDVHDDIFTDAYESKGDFDLQAVTRLFGGRYDHTAWWTEDPIEVTAIHMIPMTGSTLYFAKYPEKVKAVYDSIWGKQWKNYLTLHDQNGWITPTSEYMHQDLLAEFYALADPEAAMEKWSIDDINGETVIEAGESRAHTYGFIQSMIEYGTPDFKVTGSTAMSMAFKNKDGKRTYAAQNFSDEEQKVYFSDGTYITVPAHSSYVGGKEGDEDNPGLKAKVSYTVETYLQNLDKSGYDMTSTTARASAGDFTLKPETIEGFTFDSTAANVLTGTLEEGKDNEVTFKVYYTRNTYPITYELDGGVNAADNPAEYLYGTSVTLQDPAKTGFTFGGWYRDAAFTRLVDAISNTEAGAVTLYAKWTSENEATYTTQVYMQNPALRSYEKVAEKELTGEIGEEVSLEYEGDKTGFVLNEEKSVKNGTILADGSLVLCLYYDREKYSVTYHLNEGKNAYGNADSYVYGVGMALITPSREGYTFHGWYSDEACTEGNRVDDISNTDSGAKDFWAKWSETPEPGEPVEPDPGGDGDTNLPADSKFSFSYDADKKLVTISADYPDADNITCYIARYQDEETAMKAFQSATAALPGISIETFPNHMGIGLIKGDNGFSKEISEIPSVEEGNYIVFGFNINGQLSAETAYYYAKIGGTGSGGNTGGDTSKTSYTVNHYKQNVTLESYELAESVTITDVEAGSEVTAEPASYEGYTFDEEHSVVSGTVKADGGLVLNLYYDRDSYSITYENMDGAVNPNVNKYYYGEGLVLLAPEKEGYVFEGWYTDPTFAEDSRIERIDKERRENVTVYAKWAEAQNQTAYTVRYYKQNLTLNGYEEVVADRVNGQGPVNSTVTAQRKDYAGFTCNEKAPGSVLKGTISEDGSLVLKVYYDRNHYTVRYHNLQHAQNADENKSEYVYGIGMTLGDPVREDFVFNGWYTDAACTEESKITGIGTDALGEIDLYAKWQPAVEGQLVCTVKYYIQNTELNGYEELAGEREEILAMEGDNIQAQVKVLQGFTHNPKAEGTLLNAVAAEGVELAVYYDRNHYKITYHNVTAEENPAENKPEYVYGVGMQLARPKQRNGSYFAGWYTSEDWAPEHQMVEIGSEQIGDLALYARWVDESYVAKYTVEYYLQDTALEEYVKAAGDTMTAYTVVGETVTAPVKTYMGFTRNNKVTGSIESGVVTEDGKLVLRLYYDRNVYKIQYQNVEGAELTDENADHYVYGVGTALGTASREGYVFNGWYTDKNMTEVSKITSISTSSTGNLTLYAGWTLEQAEYQVKYYLQNKSLDGYEEVAADELFKKADTNSTVKAEVKEYEGFTCNEKAPGSVLEGIVSENGSLVLKVYYDRNKYGITYHNLEGAENAEENVPEYVYGVGMKLKAPSKEEYEFGGWYTDAACTKENRIAEIGETDTGAKDVYAKWIAEGKAASYRTEYYLQNTILDDYEHVEEEDYEGYGAIGESVDAPAKVFAGFTKNTEAEGYEDSGVVTEDGSLVLKVYYDRNRYDITYNNMEETKNPNSEQYTYGVTLYLKDPAKKGYVFGGWYQDADFRKKVTQIDAGRTGKVELYAKWTDKSELLWTVDAIADQYYTGKKITPVVVVKDRETGRKLQLNKDYTVKYQNNLNAGTATVVITGKGNYAASRNITFNILPIDLGTDETVLAEDVYKYATGKAVKISPVVKWGTKKLKLNKDFRIDTSVEGSAAAYTAEGTYNVVLAGMGNYTGSISIEAVLSNKSAIMISKAAVKGVVNLDYQQGKQEYTQNNLQISYKGTPLQEGVHYSLQYRNNTQAGTAEMIIKGLSGNDSLKFTGTKTVKFKIKGEKLKAKNISFNQQSYLYSGGEIEPDVTVKNANGQILTEYDQYTMKYSQNVDKGKGTVIVTGTNQYEGSVKKTFTIAPLNIQDSKVDISTEESVSFTKGGAQAAVKVTYNGEVLSEGVDYTLKYSENQKTGTGKVVVTGKGNFTGKSEKTFTITAKELAAVSMIVSDVTYNPKKNMKYYLAKPVLMDAGGKTLSAGKDYAKNMTYELLEDDGSYRKIEAGSDVSQIKVGSVLRVTVTGSGDYTGNLSEVYRVIEPAKTIKGARISIAPQIYTGRAITLTEEDIISVEVKSNGSYRVIEPGQYEIVPGSYKNNTKKGTARVTLKGIDGYGGCQEASFKIEAQDIEKTTIISRILSWLRG